MRKRLWRSKSGRSAQDRSARPSENAENKYGDHAKRLYINSMQQPFIRKSESKIKIIKRRGSPLPFFVSGSFASAFGKLIIVDHGLDHADENQDSRNADNPEDYSLDIDEQDIFIILGTVVSGRCITGSVI